MDWEPCSEAELEKLIADSVAAMHAPARSLWDLVRIQPAKWQLHPWGDGGDGFWVVGILGQQVVWYNDIEDGFNVSRYEALGVIAEYWCNKDELHHTMAALLQQVQTGEAPGRFGPPSSDNLTQHAVVSGVGETCKRVQCAAANQVNTSDRISSVVMKPAPG